MLFQKQILELGGLKEVRLLKLFSFLLVAKIHLYTLIVQKILLNYCSLTDIQSLSLHFDSLVHKLYEVYSWSVALIVRLDF